MSCGCGKQRTRNVERLWAQLDSAIERGRLMWWEYLAQVAFGRVLAVVREKRAEAAEALAGDLVKALTQVRDEMVTCTEWREDDPLYRIADDTLAHVEALAQRKGAP